MGHNPKYTQISTDVALRDIVNKRSAGSGFEAGIGLICCKYYSGIYRCGGSVGIVSRWFNRKRIRTDFPLTLILACTLVKE